MESINEKVGKFISCRKEDGQSVWGHFNYDTDNGCQITTYDDTLTRANISAQPNEITLAETETIKFEGSNTFISFFECHQRSTHLNNIEINKYTSPIAIEHHGIDLETKLADIRFSSIEFTLAHFRDWIGWEKLWGLEKKMSKAIPHAKIIKKIIKPNPHVILDEPFRVKLLLEPSNCPVNESPSQWADVAIKFDFSETTENSYSFHEAIWSVAIFQALISCILRVSCPIHKIVGDIFGAQGRLTYGRLLLKSGSYRTRHIDPNQLDFGKQKIYHTREYYQPDIILSDKNYEKLLRSILDNRKIGKQGSNERLRILLHIADFHLHISDNLYLYQKLFEGCKDICISTKEKQGLKKGDKFCCLRCKEKITCNDSSGLQPAHVCDILSPELEEAIVDLVGKGVLTSLCCNFRELRNEIAHHKKDAVLGADVGVAYVMLLSLQFIVLEHIFESLEFERPNDYFKMIFNGVKKFLPESKAQDK